MSNANLQPGPAKDGKPQDGIAFGRLLRAASDGFVAGCRVDQLGVPSLGALVRVPVTPDYAVYGLVQEIRIEDDGLVRQLAISEDVPPYVIADNRINRMVPVEISVLSVGYREKGNLYHLLPPRPPLSLEEIVLCSPEEICAFSGSGRFGYFRHILRSEETPVAEILAAHLRQAADAQRERGNGRWVVEATREIIILLRDDYAVLTTVLSALGDSIPEFW